MLLSKYMARHILVDGLIIFKVCHNLAYMCDLCTDQINDVIF